MAALIKGRTRPELQQPFGADEPKNRFNASL